MMKRKPETTAFYRKRLPHWEVTDGCYFVTIGQRGVIPSEAVEKIREIGRQLNQLKGGELLEQRRRIFRKIEDWLDRPYVEGLLARTEVAELIISAMIHQSRAGVWQIEEFVIMPTHLHMFIRLLKSNLKDSINAFKRWTGHQVIKLPEISSGVFWQREWFDHWSRSPEEDEKIMRYIRENPVKAGLVDEYRKWPYGSWNRILE